MASTFSLAALAAISGRRSFASPTCSGKNIGLSNEHEAAHDVFNGLDDEEGQMLRV